MDKTGFPGLMRSGDNRHAVEKLVPNGTPAFGRSRNGLKIKVFFHNNNLGTALAQGGANDSVVTRVIYEEDKMRKFRAVVIGVAATLICALAALPAHAAVIPNGSMSMSISGVNTVDTVDITAATSSLTLTGPLSLGSFLDPYLGNPNNFCAVAGGGCTAPHAPGFLHLTDAISLSLLTFPVGGGIHAIVEHVTITDGVNVVDFDFTAEFTSTLTPATAISAGTITVNLVGIFGSDSTGSYTLGGSADMSITCTQATIGSAIGCGGSIETPSRIVLTPEPASLVLLGLGLAGLGLVQIRRRKV